MFLKISNPTFLFSIILMLSLPLMSESKPDGMYNTIQDIFVRTKTQLKSLQRPSNSEELRRLDSELSRCEGINILEITISELQILFQTNRLTSLQLTRCYLKRIKLMDPYLHSVIEVNPDAESIAAKLDKERRRGKQRGKLHGIPILIKDNIGTTDKMQTTAGSLALIGVRPRSESTVVRKLRKAGAVLLGKTNLSEFAGFRDYNTNQTIPSGWSSRGNRTLSPYKMSADPSGSSTGSAVAVAANFAVLALGTETSGSIISPAQLASLVGLKPTIGLIPTDGIIPLAFSQDCVGPLACSVRDAGIVFDVLAGFENFQFPHSRSKLKKNFRVGVFRDPFWNNTVDQLPQLDRVLSILRSSSLVTIVDPVGRRPTMPLGTDLTVLTHEFKFGINKYLKYGVKYNGRISSLGDIIRYNKNHPSLLGYGQNLLIASEATNGLQNKTYKRQKERIMRAAQILPGVLKKFSLDAIVTPTENSEVGMTEPYILASITGYPSITVPAGFTKGNLPFGILLQGEPDSEHLLLKLAAIVENKIQARRRPMFLP